MQDQQFSIRLQVSCDLLVCVCVLAIDEIVSHAASSEVPCKGLSCIMRTAPLQAVLPQVV